MLFEELQGRPDEFAALAGSTGITDANMVNYIGAVEVMVDELLAETAEDGEHRGAYDVWHDESISSSEEEAAS